MLISILVILFLALHGIADASCGCLKPPIPPSDIIPSVGWSGSRVTIYHPMIQTGERWKADFRIGNRTFGTNNTAVDVVDITKLDGSATVSALVIHLPDFDRVGPASIRLQDKNGPDETTIPSDEFTVTSPPIMLDETPGMVQYQAEFGVSEGGQVMVAFGGLANVCQSMVYRGNFTDVPIRFADSVPIIWNQQGFLLDLMQPGSSTFVKSSGSGSQSDEIHYHRHDFEEWCTNHAAGGSQEVAPESDWHDDGSVHIEYDTVVVGVLGTLEGGYLTAGTLSGTIEMETATN